MCNGVKHSAISRNQDSSEISIDAFRRAGQRRALLGARAAPAAMADAPRAETRECEGGGAQPFKPWEKFRDRYGHWGCALFLWAARQLCGLALRAAGTLAGGMHFFTLSTAIRRLQARAAHDPALRRLQHQLPKLANDEPGPVG